MQPPARLALAGARRIASAASATRLAPMAPLVARSSRLFHGTGRNAAVVTPLQGNGPPPDAPVATDPAFREDNAAAVAATKTTPATETTSPKPTPPAADAESTRNSAEDARVIHKRRRQAIILQAARDVKAAGVKSLAELQKVKALPKRFWREVHVREVDGAWEVHLDSRKVRHPTTKQILRVPATKPQLAYALANEWDQMESVRQMTQQHMVPLTGLVCRALDIRDDDAAHRAAAGKDGTAPTRASAVATAMRYLDTDNLLCWAPPDAEALAAGETTLRELQERAARPIMAHLESRVWTTGGGGGGSVRLRPALDGGGMLPTPQDPAVHDAVRAWLSGLDAFDLAGVERAALAGKSVLVAARLVARWSENGLEAKVADEEQKQDGEAEFGVEEATEAASVEVRWQTGRWGEVEDTHDVEKEDLRRQFGSVVLLVSGGEAPRS
ncbi:hypothetical protein RB594_004953 [Gaeumannomyces avenae]